MTPPAVRPSITLTRTTGPGRLRRAHTPQPSAPRKRRLLHLVLTFAAVVLIADGLVGEKSFIVTSRARQQSQLESARLAALRAENAQLREQRRRLMEDRETIEAEARRQLGLAKAGEVMFILKDIQAVEQPSSHQRR
jgi:cell division protein FtsB